jgi:hypothetical protein
MLAQKRAMSLEKSGLTIDTIKTIDIGEQL